MEKNDCISVRVIMKNEKQDDINKMILEIKLSNGDKINVDIMPGTEKNYSYLKDILPTIIRKYDEQKKLDNEKKEFEIGYIEPSIRYINKNLRKKDEEIR